MSSMEQNNVETFRQQDLQNVSVRGSVIKDMIAGGMTKDKILGVLNITPRQYQYALSKLISKVENKSEYNERNVDKSFTQQLKLDIKDGTVVVFSDSHVIPDQDMSVAAHALVAIIKNIKPHYVVCLGDTFDFASISKHDPLGWNKLYSVNDELKSGVDLLDTVREASGSAKLLMTLSNHDQRYDKRLSMVASDYRDIFGMSLMDHIKGWQHGVSIMINESNGYHKTILKHQFNGGIHTAYQNVLKSGISIITGHTHRLTTRSLTDYLGTRYGVEVGTLAELDNPHFLYTEHSPCDWISGFVVLTFKDGNLLQPEHCHVLKGKAYFRGCEVV